jgi:hypothetical protein
MARITKKQKDSAEKVDKISLFLEEASALSQRNTTVNLMHLLTLQYV